MILVLGVVLVVAIQAVFHPWGFYFGGHAHLLPVWQGKGTLYTAAGDYRLSMWFEPTSGGRVYNNPTVKGWGYLCTPRGERYPLQVYGGMHEHTAIDSNGKDFALQLRPCPWYWQFTQPRLYPRLNLRGKWQNPDLVMNDEGTLAESFYPDGRLYEGTQAHQPAKGTPVEIVFHETSWSEWSRDCR
jgi:hypothetical protein